MLYGMSYEQFWYGDPWMTRAYAQSYILKRRARNEELWLEGIYFTHALNAVIGSAFGKKKINYIDKPLDIFEKTQAEKDQEIRNERRKLINTLMQWKAQWKRGQGADQNGKP